MRKIFLFVTILFASFAWGADISNYASGFENGTTGINKRDCDAITEYTAEARTGAKCLSTALNSNANKFWNPYVTFAVPDGSYLHIIGYAKLKSDDTTPTSSNTQAYADAYIFKSKIGTPVNLTTSWQRFTASSNKSESDETGAVARFYRKHAGKKEVLFDDIIAYVSTKSAVDLTDPSPATSASATETEITWTRGSDSNTGIQATLIWKRIDGTENDLTLNNQGIYALAATEGPKTDKSGHWELVKILAGDATSYSVSEPFASNERYAIVHRDLAYNYSTPTYVTTPDLTIRTLFLKPNSNWLQKGGSVSPRFAVYCYDSKGDYWYNMEEVTSCNSNKVYKAEIKASHTGLIFCRMAGNKSENNWDNKWNQTGDLTMPATEAGVFEKSNDNWDSSPNDHWLTQPLGLCISSPNTEIGSNTWLCCVGEQLTLTATSLGATHYQWYRNGTAIPGATTATYINNNFQFENAGQYYCKTQLGTGAELTSSTITIKTLRMYFNVGRGGDLYRVIDLRSTSSPNIAVGTGFLGENWTYAFTVTDGCGHYYGCNNNDNEGGWMKYGNCTNWEMNSDQGCYFHTSNGATYTFEVNYSNMSKPRVSAIFPISDQAADIKIYFDNSLVNWDKTNLHYRVGKTDYTSKYQIYLVPGTDNLFQYTTVKWNGLKAWHIAENCGNSGSGFSIYETKTGNSYQIDNAVTFEGGAATRDITIVPTGSHSTGGDSYNNNCEFYNYQTVTGMLTQNVMIDNAEHGTVTVSYTDTENHSQSFTSGDRDLAHTCILKIEAEATTTGYTLGSLTVNGADFTSGNTYILSERTIIDAEFVPATYNVTLHTNGGFILYGDVTEYTFGEGAILPTDVLLTGQDFTGWYDNAGLTGTPVTEIPADATGDKEFWAGWKNPPAMFQYILGSCYMKDDMWKAGGTEGDIAAWRYIPGADVESGTVVATDHISISTTTVANQYFNSKDLTLLDTESSWTEGSSSSKTIRALKVSAGKTVTFNLGSLQATKIIFYAFPDNNGSYTIDLTVNGTTRTKSFAAGEKGTWHRYQYRGSLTGEFSVKSNSHDTRVVVIVEVPKVTISFDKNHADASGTMAPQDMLKGHAETLKENEFENDDYFFLGWNEDAGGSGTLILDGAAYTASEDVTLYAQWEKKIYSTINLVATDAYNHYTSSVKATYKLAMPGITTLPMRVGYVFDGYYDAPDGAGSQYYTGSGLSVRNWDKIVPEATLYAKWTLPCDLEPTITNTMPIVTIWDGKYVDEAIVKLSYDFDAEGITYSIQSVSPSDPIPGCHFELFDDQIHIIGTSALGNSTTETITVTFTIANNCDPAHVSQPFTSTIRINPSSQKPKVAFIITGTKNGAFAAYSAADAAACNDLVTYLNSYFDVTFVNGYASQDEDELATYYAQYDLLVITDFLNTQAGYTNALGTLIDKKPILSFEAYVANLPNWHIHSNPATPSPKVQNMKVLCAGHTIFKDIVNLSDTTVHVLDALSSHSKAKGLQGFTVHEAPDFIFLATIRDNSKKRDLVVCCERQVVFPARLLIYGINSYEMGNLSDNGKIAMRQMIEYLLMTDETKVADCSLVFDNHSGDNKWSTKENWAPGYNMIPTPYHPTRIIAECHVDADDAHASSVKINKGTSVNGSLIIKPTGGLTVAGMVATVKDTRYASPITTKAEDLLIEGNETNNGALVYGNKESDVRATVQYYSRGSDAKTAHPIWQYMGIPFQPGEVAQEMFYLAWMCRWTSASTDGIGGIWQWVNDYDVLLPFEGYCITQEAAKTYTFAGKLNPPVTTTLVLDNRDADGYAFAANSWTAPIKISQMKDEDFVNTEKTIYIYHSGTYEQWNTNKENVINPKASSADPAPGQYVSIPIHSAPYIGADSVIPSMQGFFVKTTAANAELKLVYNRTVYDSKYFRTSTQPMRAPRSDEPEVMQLIVSGDSYGDRVHLLARNDFSEDFQDGWDGRKLEGDADAPMLAVVKETGSMAIAAVPTIEERELSFRAGSDTEYAFGFNYEGETIYLYDRLTGEATEIKTGNTYSFTAENKTAAKRFLITKDPRRIPTDIDNVQRDDVQGTNAEKCIIDGLLYIIKDNRFYDARGVRVNSFKRKEVTP